MIIFLACSTIAIEPQGGTDLSWKDASLSCGFIVPLLGRARPFVGPVVTSVCMLFLLSTFIFGDVIQHGRKDTVVRPFIPST